jgi:hypothetical protein
MFHDFNQNNSGGGFDFDKRSGITHHVIIEGRDIEQIIERAENIGIYFNGCETGQDCECCGDRWCKPWSSECREVPTVYGQEVGADKPFKGYLWCDKEDMTDVCIHYLEGRIVWVTCIKE